MSIYPAGAPLVSPINGYLDIDTGGAVHTRVQAVSGTVVLNGSTPVNVTNAAVNANSFIIFTLKTVSGTVGAVPVVETKTAGTGFTVAGTAGDDSTYDYLILG